MKPKSLKLDLIVTTAGTQIRASINSDAVDQYAEAMLDSTNEFPAVVVFHDGNEYILADGFHRVMAASRNGFKDILADVRKGSKSDALKYALGANATHGIPRTNRDKRRCVELALAEWPKISDREIARICAVSNQFASNMRSELSTVDSSHKCKDCGAEISSTAAHFTGQCRECHLANPPTRIGADGKERRLPAKKSPQHVPTPEEREVPALSLDAEWKSALGDAQLPDEEIDYQETIRNTLANAWQIASKETKEWFKKTLL